MGQIKDIKIHKGERFDFEWVNTKEPHGIRRDLMLQKYPQIKHLMGVDPNFKWIVTLYVLIQLFTFYLLRNVTSIWVLGVVGYVLTGTINMALSLAIHEIAHNQAFGVRRPLANKIFGMFANLPLGVPASVSFKRFHNMHHRYLGNEMLDPDVPSKIEGWFFRTALRKFIWVVFEPFFYTLRPLLVCPGTPGRLEYWQWVVQIAFNYLIGVTLGWHIVAYILFVTIFCFGFHPTGGRFIAEHYLVYGETKDYFLDSFNNYSPNDSNNNSELIKHLIPDTCSYYGPFNAFMFNGGYHVEHHDFPSIPGSKLPLLREIAPEFYDHLHHHPSWTKLIFDFIFDPSVSPYARVKRPYKGDKSIF